MASSLASPLNATGVKELFRSKPFKRGRDSIAIKLVIEMPKSSFAGTSLGVDVWSTALPADGAAWSAVVSGSGATWLGFQEPTLDEVEVDPRYRTAHALVTLTFVGNRVWAD